MKHRRSKTPAYLIWVEQRPTKDGKGKQAYFEAVWEAARSEIDRPIITADIEVEIVYSTDVRKGERMDADNVSKSTLDALKGVAYDDDSQVRSATSTLFDRHQPSNISGLVEHMSRLFYSGKPHVVLIMIYSDTRLRELGGEQEVQRRRYLEWQRTFDQMLSQIKKKFA